jgi:hypothetical protein
LVKVLTGPNAGRTLALDGDQVAVGRVGVQVASIRRQGEGYVVLPLEGAPPAVNGVPVPGEGSPLRIGDVLEVAGARLEMVAAAAPSAD